MGQYYKIVNLDKRQYLIPHDFGDGLKLMEFGMSGHGTMTALAILLASGNGRGGGDLSSEKPIVGSWAGDRIVIAGDYDDAFKHFGLSEEAQKAMGGRDLGTENLYEYAEDHFENIAKDVLEAMKDDEYLRNDLLQSAAIQSSYSTRERSPLIAAFTAREISEAVKKLNAAPKDWRGPLRPDMVISIGK